MSSTERVNARDKEMIRWVEKTRVRRNGKRGAGGVTVDGSVEIRRSWPRRGRPGRQGWQHLWLDDGLVVCRRDAEIGYGLTNGRMIWEGHSLKSGFFVCVPYGGRSGG